MLQRQILILTLLTSSLAACTRRGVPCPEGTKVVVQNSGSPATYRPRVATNRKTGLVNKKKP
jgi:hypothetical protein